MKSYRMRKQNATKVLTGLHQKATNVSPYLNDMFDDNCGSKINDSRLVASGEGLLPTIVSHCLKLRVKDISCHDRVHKQLAESAKLLFGGEEDLPQICVRFIHKKIPGKVDRVLFGDTLVSVGQCHLCLLLNKSHVGHTRMVYSEKARLATQSEFRKKETLKAP